MISPLQFLPLEKLAEARADFKRLMAENPDRYRHLRRYVQERRWPWWRKFLRKVTGR